MVSAAAGVQANKRRRSTPPTATASPRPTATASPRPAATAAAQRGDPPSTRSRTPALRVFAAAEPCGAADAASKSGKEERCSFLDTEAFESSLHVPGLYGCVGTSGGLPSRLAVREKGAPLCDAAAGRGVNPFQVIDFNDKQGIWHNEEQVLRSFGEDPAKELRRCVEGGAEKYLAPAGLLNLGATCYLNSLLQYLFFNVDFRRSLLHAFSDSVALHSLQRVFAFLAGGDRGCVDPGAFVRAARIDAVAQADASEFSALLLDWLERELNEGKLSSTATHPEQSLEQGADQTGIPKPLGGRFISALFQGEVSQQLQCSADPAHVFERRENFYELRAQLAPLAPDVPEAARRAAGHVGSHETVVVPPELNAGLEVATAVIGAAVGGVDRDVIPHQRTPGKRGSAGGSKRAPPTVLLEQLLEETTFPEEKLDGANQYHCPRCDCKVDAWKATRPSKLPPYLHVTIERYHYDLKKFERKKLNHVVSFPTRLQIRVKAIALAPTPSSVATPARGQVSSESGTVGHDAPGLHAAVAVAEGMLPVVYECVGFLEHVADSAESGHYTATLLQDDADAGGALHAAVTRACARLAPGGGGAPATDPEPLAKRQCCAGDEAGGVPRGGKWWKMDDDVVSPVTWVTHTGATRSLADGADAIAAEAARGAPRRIESPGAYLLLYRRVDRAPRNLGKADTVEGTDELPTSLATVVASTNAELAEARLKYQAKTKMAEQLTVERRITIDALARALRSRVGSAPAPPDDRCMAACSGLTIVPTAWLDTFLRGGELLREGSPPRAMDVTTDRLFEAPPPLYGKALIDGPEEERPVLDPLAVWCGHVKFVSTSALRELSGLGGVDDGSFLDAEEVLHADACRATWDIFQAWREERRQVERVLQGKLNLLEARTLQDQGRGGEVTWISTRVLNVWRKQAVSTGGAGEGSSIQLWAQWWSFVQEAGAARFGVATAVDAKETEGLDAASWKEVAQANLPGLDATSARASSLGAVSTSCEVVLTAGCICQHGLLSQPKCCTPVLRRAVRELLEAAKSKEAAYRRHWPLSQRVPRMRSGLPDGGLLELGDVCSECHGDAAALLGGGAGAGAGAAEPPQPCQQAPAQAQAQAQARRSIDVRQRYPSGSMKKLGCISVPSDDVAPLTSASISQLVLAKFGLRVGHVYPRGPGKKALHDAEALAGDVDAVLVEKAYEGAPTPGAADVERDGAAFETSIFRSATN